MSAHPSPTILHPVPDRRAAASEELQLAARVNSFSASGIRKFFNMIMEHDDVLSLGVGEPDFPTPWHIVNAGVDALRAGRTTYTSNMGALELRQAIAEHMDSRFGLQYDPEKEILVTAGVSEGFDLAMRAIVNPGDEVIIPAPSYVMYEPAVRLAEGEPVFAPTMRKDDFRLTPETLRDCLTEETRVVVLSFPANPTGAVLDGEQLAELAEILQGRDIWVVSDEIYAELLFDRRQRHCMASFEGMRERTLVLDGLSKTYAMTGWRVGYALGDAQLIDAMVRIHQYTQICAPVMSQFAAIEALRNGQEDAQRMRKEYERRRGFLVDGLNDLGLECMMPGGSFYAFPSIACTGLTSVDFAERLLKEQNVAVVPGTAFGELGEGYVRLVYAASIEDLEEALKRIERFLRTL